MASTTKQPTFILFYKDIETVRLQPKTYADLVQLTREWLVPPEGTTFTLRVSKGYLPSAGSGDVDGQGRYVWVGDEETWKEVVEGAGEDRVRVEIVAEAAWGGFV